MTSSLSSKEFRDSLGLFATGIAVATTSDGTDRAGITVNSFASVSIDPPLVLFSVGRARSSFDLFSRASGFAINVLHKDQIGLSQLFSKPGADKWAKVSTRVGKHGGVIIQPALVAFDCKMHRHYEGGDHSIFVGEVVQMDTAEIHEPLIYFRSTYCELASPQAPVAIL